MLSESTPVDIQERDGRPTLQGHSRSSSHLYRQNLSNSNHFIITAAEDSEDNQEHKRLELKADQAEWSARNNEKVLQLQQKYGRAGSKTNVIVPSAIKDNTSHTAIEFPKEEAKRKESVSRVNWHNAKDDLYDAPGLALTSHPSPTQNKPTSNEARLARQASESLNLASIDDDSIRSFLDPSNDSIDFSLLSTWSLSQLNTLLASMKPPHFKTFLQKAVKAGVQPTASHLTFSRVTYTDEMGNPRLRDVSGTIRDGEITGIFAAPDSNASLLLELLSNRKLKGRMDGAITYGNAPPSSSFMKSVGFIDQNETHIALLTVEEALFYSARLRLPDSQSDALVRLRVAIIMKLLDLSHVAGSYIGNAMMNGISGGQKRRLSVGMEMAAGHSVLLGDLISNGLDNVSAYNLIRTLRHMVGAGLAVACTVVQAGPELYNLFHRVIVMSKGTILYTGPPDRAVRYFKSVGFPKPEGKSIPQFLEELSAEPEMFYRPSLAGEIREKGERQGEEEEVDDFSAHPSLFSPTVVDLAHKGKDYSLMIQDVKKSEQNTKGAKSEGGVVAVNEERVTAWYAAVEAYQHSIFYAGVREEIAEMQGKRPPADTSGNGGGDKGGAGGRNWFSAKWYSYYNSNPWLQLRENTRRQAIVFYRQRSLWRDNFIKALIMGFLIGSLFYQLTGSDVDLRSRVGLYFYMTAYLAFNSFYLLPVILMQRPLVYKETFAGYYTPSMYYFSFILVQLVVFLIEEFILLVPIWGLSSLRGIPLGGPFWFAFLVLFFAAMIARNWIIFIIYLSPSETFATTSLTVSFYLFALLSGGFIQRDLTPAGWSWAFTIDFFNYTMTALVLNDPKNPTRIGELFGYDLSVSKWTNLENLVYFFLTFSAAAIWAVSYINWYRIDYPVISDFTSKSSKEMMEEQQRLEEEAKKKLVKKEAFLEFRHLNYFVPTPGGEKQILKDVCGYVGSSHFVALIGKSGAGKSTLLDVLAGKKTVGKLSGDILFNGRPVDMKNFSRYVGYVEQFNSHNPLSTVREAIEFSARLRLSSKISDAEVKEKVQHVIDVLNLRGVENAIIGYPGSGGGVSLEISKKVTIAVELVMEPFLLLLDEPTTGLDSAGAFSVMRSIRGLSSSMAVICTVHQPSIELVQFFQDVLLLENGGRVVYEGSMKNLPSYFESQGFEKMEAGKNVSDYALELVAKHQEEMAEGGSTSSTQDLGDMFANSEEGKAMMEVLNAGVFPTELRGLVDKQMAETNAFKGSFFTQLRLLTRRFFLNTWRNRPALTVRYLFALIFGFFVGTVFFNLSTSQTRGPQHLSCLFFTVGHFLFSSSAFFADIFMARTIYFREFTNKMYGTEAYFLARLVADLPHIALECFIPTIMIYFLASLNPLHHSSHYGYFYWACIIVRITGILLVQLIASLIAAPDLAYSVLATIMYVMFLLTGFFIPQSSIPSWWIWLSDLDFLKYALQFLSIEEYEDMLFTCDPNDTTNVVVSASEAASYPICNNMAIQTFPNPADPSGATVLKCQFACGDEVLASDGVNFSVAWEIQSFVILHCFTLFFFLCGYLALKFINHVKR